jgi:hyperosmotically inducible periplasmic protein
MKRNLVFLAVVALALAPSTFAQGDQNQPKQSPNPAQLRIQKEVVHELLMLPWFGVFDNIAFQVDGNTVTLLGEVSK